MAIKFEREAFPGNTDVFWRQEVRMLPGGFQPVQTVPVGEVVQRGAFIAVDFDAMSAAIVKVGKVLEGGTTSKPRVSKRNNFFAGDTVMKVGKTDAAVTVKNVDRSNPDYDVVELSAAITGLAKDDFIQEAVKDDGGSTYSPAYVANMVLGTDFISRAQGIATFDVAWSAMVLKDICTPFPTSWLADNSPCMATNHNILFIKQ
jgi:hypothetical protein